MDVLEYIVIIEMNVSQMIWFDKIKSSLESFNPLQIEIDGLNITTGNIFGFIMTLKGEFLHCLKIRCYPIALKVILQHITFCLILATCTDKNHTM